MSCMLTYTPGINSSISFRVFSRLSNFCVSVLRKNREKSTEPTKITIEINKYMRNEMKYQVIKQTCNQTQQKQ